MKRIPNDISYEELGHDANIFPAFSPDYELNDIGQSFDLTVTLFGYQLGTEEVKRLIEALNEHILIDKVHHIVRSQQ